MIRVETERLILKNYSMDDLDDIYEYFSTEEVAKYEDFDPMTKQEVIDTIEEWKDQDSRLVAELKDSHKVIGSVGYFVDEDGDYSIDFDFNPKFSKQGYAYEASRKLIDYLFNTVKIKSIFGDCDVRNENSWRLMEKLGFKRIDTLENESYKEDKDGNDILIDIYIYLLKNE